MRRSFLLLCAVCLLTACPGAKLPESALTPEAIRAQMRWPFADAVGVSREIPRNPHYEVQELLARGDTASLEKARRLLEDAIAAAPGAALSEERDLDQERTLINLAWQLAMLHAITGDPAPARRAASILENFAETLPKWKLIARDGKSHSQDERAYQRNSEANGFWRWHPLDLAEAIPLLRAYDIIRPSLSEEERTRLREDLFIYHKRLIDRFTGQSSLYGNLAGYHLTALMRFGQVLDRPDFAQEVADYWGELMRFSYSPDGFFRQITPAYHVQITTRMIEQIPALLRAQTGLDLEAKHPALFERIRAVPSFLALPNGRYIAIEDSTPEKPASKDSAEGAKHPGLLGVSGLAKLGVGGMTAFLKFDGIRGHDHRDALGLIWFAAGMEIFSDTSYRPIPGSGATRAWIADTAAHNTVAIDEKMHFLNRGDFAVPRRVAGFTAFPPEKPGTAPLEAALPAAAGYSNQGRLIAWDAEPGGIQAMEAEQERVDAAATLFRRTVVMVPLAGDEGFLVDIFRIQGGSTHDYFLRGGLDEAAQIRFDADLSDADGTAYQYIQVKKRGPVELPLSAQITFASGKASVFSRLAALYGSPDSTVEAVLGEAPAIRRPGLAPFSFIRHQIPSGKDSASCFVWVHEATRGGSRIQDVHVEENKGNVVVRVRSEGREDWIFSGTETDSVMRSGGFEFDGRLASATVVNDRIAARVHSGTRLRKDGQAVAERPRPLVADVTGTLRKDAGDATDSVRFSLPAGASLQGYRLAHLDLGDAIRFSIPVTAVHAEGSQARVDLSHTPGFVVEDGAIVMTNFPGWRIRGTARLHLE